VAALLWYNKARFGVWLEFGTRLQLTQLPFRFSPRYFAANLYTYLLRPVAWSCRFPFEQATWNMTEGAFPSWWSVPRGYLVNEPVAGLLRAVPCVWLIPVALIGAWSAARRLRAGTAGPTASGQVLRLWCAASFAVMGTLAGAMSLGLYMATMRYLLDVTLGLVLLGVLGGWLLWSRARGHRLADLLARTTCVAAGVATIAFGLLLGYSGYHEHFERNNPALNQRLVNALSTCGGGSGAPARLDQKASSIRTRRIGP
jgi:hypothetical protein